jgi:hypothetical protein
MAEGDPQLRKLLQRAARDHRSGREPGIDGEVEIGDETGRAHDSVGSDRM